MGNLNSRQLALIQSVRDSASARDAEILEQVISGVSADYDIQRVCELINDEYLMKGIGEDYTPNEYGRELEALLNAINAPRLS